MLETTVMITYQIKEKDPVAKKEILSNEFLLNENKGRRNYFPDKLTDQSD